MIPFDIAFIHPSTVHTGFALSLTETIRNHPNTNILPTSGKAVVYNKNQTTRQWLQQADKDWLLWTDTDITWTQTALDRLLKTAEEAGTYSAMLYHYDNHANTIYPSVFTVRDKDDRLRAPVSVYADLPQDRPYTLPGVGGGFMLTHRLVYETLTQQPHIEGYPFFFVEEKDGIPQGYTQYFFKKAADLGFPVIIEPRCQVQHHETIGLTHQIYDHWWHQE